MAPIKNSLQELNELDGYMCSALVDASSGMMLGSNGSALDLEVAAAGNTEVVRAKMKAMKALGLNDKIEDILITLGKQYHLIRLCAQKEGIFFYLVLDRNKANLAIARRKLSDLEHQIEF